MRHSFQIQRWSIHAGFSLAILFECFKRAQWNDLNYSFVQYLLLIRSHTKLKHRQPRENHAALEPQGVGGRGLIACMGRFGANYCRGAYTRGDKYCWPSCILKLRGCRRGNLIFNSNQCHLSWKTDSFLLRRGWIGVIDLVLIVSLLVVALAIHSDGNFYHLLRFFCALNRKLRKMWIYKSTSPLLDLWRGREGCRRGWLSHTLF